MDHTEVRLRDSDPYDYDGSRDRIVDLAGRGFTAAYIHKLTSIPYKVVQRLMRSEFAERSSNRQQVIEAHAQTVQWLKMKVTERMHSMGGAWDRRDGELLLKILERESKLFGVDQPTQHQHDVSITYEELSNDELLSQLAAAGYSLQITTPKVLMPVEAEDAQFTVHDTAQHQSVASPEAGSDSQRE